MCRANHDLLINERGAVRIITAYLGINEEIRND